MKLSKIAISAVVGTVLASSARADQTFYLYGSTAYRKATEEALRALFAAGTFTSLQYDDGTANKVTVTTIPADPLISAIQGSTNLIWKGQIAAFGTQNVTIYANWAGSVGGIRSVVDNSYYPVTTFLADGQPYGTYSSSAAGPGGGPIDVAMADCDQISTQYDPTVNPGFPKLTETLVAVLEFTWAKGNGGPSGLANVNPWSLKALEAAGTVPLSQFTGVPTDKTTLMYLTGRNDDSGTRILAQVDSFFPTINSMTQWRINSPYAMVAFGPGPNLDGDGYNSGGDVKTALNLTGGASYVNPDLTTNPHGELSYIMGYISCTDATSSMTGTAGSRTTANCVGGVPTTQWLSYNGIPWSEGAITEGAYTYFSYEHLDYNFPSSPTTQQSAAKTFGDALAVEQEAQAGVGTIVPGTMPISVMDINHRSDGSVIVHK